jgi:hypothetical protein
MRDLVAPSACIFPWIMCSIYRTLDQEAFWALYCVRNWAHFGESAAHGGPWAGKFALLFVFVIEPTQQLGPWKLELLATWGQRREPPSGGRSRNNWWTYGFVLCRAWRKAGKWILHSVNLFEPSVIPIFKCPYTSSLTTRWVNGNNERRKKEKRCRPDSIKAATAWQGWHYDTKYYLPIATINATLHR